MQHPKMDKLLIAGTQDYEVQHVVDRFRQKEGIEVSHDEVKAVIKEHGHSRRRVYAIIRERHAATHEINGLSDIILPE